MLQTVLLLGVANIFMTTACYGHLRYTHFPLWKVVLASWSIALIEYCFQVPSNRFGYSHFSASQLKTIQEILTLVVFAAFSVFHLKESLRWNHLVAFVLIVGAAYFMFKR